MMTELPDKRFYPGWHSIGQFVPIYNLIVLFQHFHTIQTIQMRNGTLSNINLGLLTFVIIIAFGIVAVAYFLKGLLFASVVVVLTYSVAAIGIAWWGQENLNRYWVRATATRVRSAATGPGEMIISVTGAASVLVIVLLTILVMNWSPSITSVSDVSSISRVIVGETTPSLGTISDALDADGYSFLAREGYTYTIEVGPAYVGEVLVHALVTLWDSNGTTVIHTTSAWIYTESVDNPIVFKWIAPSTGTRYVTVEPGGLYGGAYLVRIFSSPRETNQSTSLDIDSTTVGERLPSSLSETDEEQEPQHTRRTL
ncbi:MAG: hypothetical protein OXD46_10460 [Chloroflexi bacterium]|nr:hypothetical protein [Chloroflexota bacterium]